MPHRVLLAALLLFWGTMSWLLWRAEFGDAGNAGSRLPLDTVWNRLLTAPDDSTLELRQRGRRLGACRVSANVDEAFATGRASSLEELEPEGRVNRIQSYTLDLDGQLVPALGERPYRFSLRFVFSTNNAWQNLHVRVVQRPSEWVLDASATNRTLMWRVTEDGESWEQQFTFEELRQPDKVLARLGVPFAAPLVAGFVGGPTPDPAQLALGLKWEARQDWFKLGHTQVRAYRLSAKLFDRFQIVIYLSRVGEILRVELPEGIVALNEAFTNL